MTDQRRDPCIGLPRRFAFSKHYCSTNENLSFTQLVGHQETNTELSQIALINWSIGVHGNYDY